ncbi:MAG: hypothetical protein ABI380_03845 [Edaphobacter sp.]
MKTYYHFESNPPMPVRAPFAIPTDSDFSITLAESKVESRTTPAG